MILICGKRLAKTRKATNSSDNDKLTVVISLRVLFNYTTIKQNRKLVSNHVLKLFQQSDNCSHAKAKARQDEPIRLPGSPLPLALGCYRTRSNWCDRKLIPRVEQQSETCR